MIQKFKMVAINNHFLVKFISYYKIKKDFLIAIPALSD